MTTPAEEPTPAVSERERVFRKLEADPAWKRGNLSETHALVVFGVPDPKSEPGPAPGHDAESEHE